MLVELNLLDHQNEFTQEHLFCIGLTETFKELMKDYNPEQHLDLFLNLYVILPILNQIRLKKFLKNLKKN